MAYNVTPNKYVAQTRAIAAHGIAKRCRAARRTTADQGDVCELSASENAFAFLAWLIAFTAFGKGIWLALVYFG